MNSMLGHSDGPDSILLDSQQIRLDTVDQDLVMAICTDATRHGSAIYSDSRLQLVADRKDPGDPYKGLDIIIQRIDPKIVVVSAAQKKLLAYLEKSFSFDIEDFSRRRRTTSGSYAIDMIPEQPQSIEDINESAKRQRLEITESTSLVGEAGVDPSQLLVDPRDQPNAISPDTIKAFTLVIVPNTWFSISKGIQKLIESDLVRSQGLIDPEEKSFYVTSKVDRSADVCAIRAISALESYFVNTFLSQPDRNETSQGTHRIEPSQQSRYNSEACGEANHFMPIIDLRYIDPGPVLSINKSTFRTLNIFAERNHQGPEAVHESSSDLEGRIGSLPSLFELLNHCQSPQGRKQLKTIMLWPLQDLVELRTRHDLVEFMVHPESRLFRDQLHMQMRNIVPLAGLLTRMQNSICSPKDFATIYKALWAFIAVIDLIKAKEDHQLEILNRIVRLDDSNLRKTLDAIIHIVDFEGSRREKRVQVYDGVNPELDEKKEVVKNLAKFCDKVAAQETAKYKNILHKACKVTYVPRIGFLANVDYMTTTELHRIQSLKEIDVILHSETSVYFKTKRMQELDDNAGDISCDLIDAQENVLIELQAEILKHSETILRLMELCGELDCLMSFAEVSFQRGYTRPEFVTDLGEIDICQLYHPLCSVKSNMIANDVRFYKSGSERSVKMMILTGPNACGKTTYMKATCLALYMAHIGCFVPAVYARVPLLDAILTRMHSGDSISTGLSSFATDLHQINFALARATEKSFIAIDEFGKGTQARDGFHLLKGLVWYFGARARMSPYVLIATHFNRLIDHTQLYSEYMLFKTFKVTKDKTGDKIVYEYTVTDGVSETSFADKVAARGGVDPHIINRANQIRDYITEGRAMRPRPPTAA